MRTAEPSARAVLARAGRRAWAWAALALVLLGRARAAPVGGRAGPALRLQHRRGRPLRAARGRDVRRTAWTRTTSPTRRRSRTCCTIVFAHLVTAAGRARLHALAVNPHEVYTLARVTVGAARHARAVAALRDRREAVRPRRRAAGSGDRGRRVPARVLRPPRAQRRAHARAGDAARCWASPACCATGAGATTCSRASASGWRARPSTPRGIVDHAARGRDRGALSSTTGPRAGRRALAGMALAGAARCAAFLLANPYSLLDYSSFHAELVHQSTLSAESQGKLGAPQTGGAGLLPVDVHVGTGLGAGAGGARRRGRDLAPRGARSAGCWCPRRCCSSRSWACRAATSGAGCCRSSRSSCLLGGVLRGARRARWGAPPERRRARRAARSAPLAGRGAARRRA